MLILPLGTDAPIYHWPRATVAMIVLNVVCFFAVPPSRSETFVDEDGQLFVSASTNFETYALTLGDGLHPVQWVTHNFLHASIGHLVGNMVFLWAFGIVVEGKLGIVRFLLVYLAIGTLHGAFTQTILLWSSLGGMPAVGASSVIFGLMAICMVWAPHNEVQCIWIFIFWFRVFVKQFDLRYTWVAALYLAEQVLGVVLGGMTGRFAGSEVLHLSGALWGFVIGMTMLKMGWVDCEGWDILSVHAKNRKLAKDWKLREARHARQKKAERAPRMHPDVEPAGEDRGIAEQAAAALKKVRKLIDMGDFASAVSTYDRSARTIPDWPSGPELLDLIKQMHTQGGEGESIPLMRDYCRNNSHNSARVRLKLAQILLKVRQKPVAALRVIEEIREGELDPKLEAARHQMIRQARQMMDEGVLELEGED